MRPSFPPCLKGPALPPARTPPDAIDDLDAVCGIERVQAVETPAGTWREPCEHCLRVVFRVEPVDAAQCERGAIAGSAILSRPDQAPGLLDHHAARPCRSRIDEDGVSGMRRPWPGEPLRMEQAERIPARSAILGERGE